MLAGEQSLWMSNGTTNITIWYQNVFVRNERRMEHVQIGICTRDGMTSRKWMEVEWREKQKNTERTTLDENRIGGRREEKARCDTSEIKKFWQIELPIKQLAYATWKPERMCGSTRKTFRRKQPSSLLLLLVSPSLSSFFVETKSNGAERLGARKVPDTGEIWKGGNAVGRRAVSPGTTRVVRRSKQLLTL